MKSTFITFAIIMAIALAGLGWHGGGVRGDVAPADAEKAAQVKQEIANRAAAELAANLVGSLTITVEGNPQPIVTDGQFVKRFFIGDKEFLMVASGNDKVLIRTQTIAVIRISPKK